ncbi:MAG TPA: MaoC family dehydratase N-terminal domain-containing protein [Ktedonobacterales bacterium]|nr:MaoC family dehydratase N-terminal domain-containing protein [Ktedonobacterales bacterium]
MPLDPSLVGHETQPDTDTISVETVRQFADAIADNSAIYHDVDAAHAAGFTTIPAPPTFVTRFIVPFAEAGLDTEHSQVLHGEQEYVYERSIGVGDALSVRHRVASIRQSRGMALMTIEQLCDTATGERAVTGKAMLVVRDIVPGETAATATPTASRPAKAREGEPLPPLTKTVTQAQIDAYADVSGDHNPIHINPDVARSVGLDGTIAHGMLSMAFAGQVLTDWLTAAPGRGRLGRLRVRFQAMVRPGDTLTCRGVLRPAEQDKLRQADVWIENQRGERVLTGDADIVGGDSDA